MPRGPPSEKPRCRRCSRTWFGTRRRMGWRSTCTRPRVRRSWPTCLVRCARAGRRSTSRPLTRRHGSDSRPTAARRRSIRASASWSSCRIRWGLPTGPTSACCLGRTARRRRPSRRRGFVPADGCARTRRDEWRSRCPGRPINRPTRCVARSGWAAPPSPSALNRPRCRRPRQLVAAFSASTNPHRR